MKTEQLIWRDAGYWERVGRSTAAVGNDVSLVLYIVDPGLAASSALFDELRGLYPNAHILSCSGAGEVLNADSLEEGAVALALSFEHTITRVKGGYCKAMEDTARVAEEIAAYLAAPDLQALMVFADGQSVNGEILTETLQRVIGEGIPVFGGMARAEEYIEKSFVGCDTAPSSGQIGCVGFYGSSLLFSYACSDGCSPFGPERRVTRAKGNVVYELDGEPALDLFKRYLGAEAKNLPGSALEFPLRIRVMNEEGSGFEYTRTVLSVNEEDRSLIFAGMIPVGSYAHLMRGSLDRLVEAAEVSALRLYDNILPGHDYAAFIVSCAGRKFAYGDRISAEIDAITEVFGDCIPTIGFYSHGEIAPRDDQRKSWLYNHTMSIFLLSERD